MVGVWGKIEVNSEITLQYVSEYNFFGNNISQPVEQSLNTKHSGSNPYLLGCSDFSMGAELVDDTVPYFIGGIAANEEGLFGDGLVYELTIRSDIPERTNIITISFDDYNNQHPNSIVIVTDDGVSQTHKVTASTQTFVTNPTSSWVIQIGNWNTPNFPLRIQSIMTNTVIEISQGSLVDLQFSGMDRSDITSPSFGIYSNSGNIEFIEKSNQIKPLKEAGVLLNRKIVFYFSNRYKDTKIGTFYISDADYSQTSNRVKLNFKDKIEKWQEVTIPIDQVLALDELSLNEIKNLISEQVKGLDFEIIYDTARWYSIRVAAPYLLNSSFWAFMTKCCELSACYIYCNENGDATISFGGGT
jgi:hypothetical protein